MNFFSFTTSPMHPSQISVGEIQICVLGNGVHIKILKNMLNLTGPGVTTNILVNSFIQM